MFTETQRFDHWWLRLLFAGLNALFAFACWRHWVHGVPLGDKPMPTGVLIVTSLVVAGATLLFLSTRLLTRVDATGVQMRFAPWQRRPRFIPWSAVQACRVRPYRPLVDFAGWGLRRSMNGRQECYTTRGDQALHLDLGDGRAVLIGTRRPEELSAVLRALGKGDGAS